MRFDCFVGIDWSGARGVRHPAVQVAVATPGGGAPQLVAPAGGGAWSRIAVLDWLAGLDGSPLVGIDAGFGFAAVPPFTGPARALWAEVETVCADEPDLGGHAFIAHRRDAFWTGAADGPRHLRAHLRVTELAYAASRRGQPTSNFVLLGASQVGKATLSAMRLLHRLRWPVWPFDPLPPRGPVILEIYAQAFAAMAGIRGKIRASADLAAALARLGSDAPPALPGRITDHVGDALITAAGLRAIAGEPHYWAPPAMTRQVAQTEGWTFGVV